MVFHCTRFHDMKFKLILLLIGVILCGIVAGNIARGIVNTNAPRTKETFSPPPTLTHKQEPVIGIPQKIRIPKIKVDVIVESVGLDSEARMDVPKNIYNTAWYNLGPRPGERGNAVINGHFDTPTGAPSVFYDLKTLTKGDEITIVDDLQKEYVYQVTRVESVDTTLFPLEEVFGKTDKYLLNLITCDGIFDRSVKTYSKRIIVYSQLKQ